MSQDLLADVLRLIAVGISLARRLRGDPKVMCETADIIVGYRDARMTAAVAGTFLAIETHGSIMFCRGDYRNSGASSVSLTANCRKAQNVGRVGLHHLAERSTVRQREQRTVA